jgi:O-6-methylguanine DNA methyltransferase
MNPRVYQLASPWGSWRAAFTDAGLRGLKLPARRSTRGAGQLPLLASQEGPLGRRIHKALKARLAGKEAEVPWEWLDLRGYSRFHLRVWKVLRAIPCGQVRTYKQVAAAAGAPRAARAVGRACAANPILLFIPCHRVVACSGLGGFGAGLAWKRRLLNLERRGLPGSLE